MEQLVAREAHNLEVVGSSPTPATEKPSRNRRFFYFLTAVFGFFSHFYCRRFYFLLLRCVSLNFRPSPDSPSPNYPPEDARFTSDYLFCDDRHYSPLTLVFYLCFANRRRFVLRSRPRRLFSSRSGSARLFETRKSGTMSVTRGADSPLVLRFRSASDVEKRRDGKLRDLQNLRDLRISLK